MQIQRLASKQKDFQVGLKLYQEIHSVTTRSYNNIGNAQRKMKDYKSALQVEEDENSNRNIVADKALQYRTLLSDLNLESNSKLTLKKARTVDNHTLKANKLTSPDQIPDYILKTLMIVNHHAREFKLKCVSADSDSDDSDTEYGINPMDALLAIFHCSDDFLRRDIATKLSACQLSVPFLLPDPVAPSENVTILLTALGSITKSWKGSFNNSNGAQQVFATEFPFPVVSFIRIGKNTIPKSSLINKIMSDGSGAHDVFFHKGMIGGNIERKIVDGLVEMAWYLPGGSEDQTLQNEICFANLRGDGRDFKKQLDFMSKISSVLCLLMMSEYLDETKTVILDMATTSQAKVIIIFNEKTQEGAKKYFSDLRERNREQVTLITYAKKWNEYDFVRSIQENIQKNINAVEAVPLVELASRASEYDIHFDGSLSRSRFEERVDSWLKLGAKDAKDLLKLQTHVPVLAGLEREIYCPRRKNKSKSKGKRIDRDLNEIYAEVEEEKNKQKQSFTDMDERISQCLNDIALMDESGRNYALAKLKHQLNKMSLQNMATLHEEYHVASINLQTRKAEEATSPEEENLKQLEESISKCSFGLEHILRELAQLYQLSDISTNDYEGAAAEMLLSGHPLELVDGDSSYIPMRWFDAVYAKLESKTNNAKIFVISVLGIQSSGKSTMLNTMFGLEFPVSAGRCTRGAFASLIPVSDSLKTASNFDYVLIIDTEGLRGSGDPQLREHDNELATFAIGVADVTIVNIFGENHNEMKEFLEIAVHAFLKMKLVKEKKVCKIVHQNVAATDATTKLAFDRVKLKEDLDKMAKVAATQENCEDQIQSLNDIISFDENKDVFYVPSFLKGSPPMAPVSPNYGRAIQRVKEDVISLMSASSSQSSISQFRERVIILWKAILKGNLISSFRNMIEVRAYTALDRKYFEESVNLMVTGMGELEKKIQVALRRSTTLDERFNVWSSSQMQIRDEAEALGKKMKQAMKKFFETNEDKSILEQWRENVMNKIVQHKENLVMDVTKNCIEIFRYLQNRQDVDEKR
ncbi:interferon-induced very large GTPase 1-like [Paramuricea clavata]|uniref:Interferon-induced very large GTPase 1-like n=1 Tax=Paramuricea clavata TaxID=317549 RepID=A0A6S7K882_PARCT|nr:interferon-induced very large GTPase 1-like [Paramuricea clavata]